jgi:hypothetical protein
MTGSSLAPVIIPIVVVIGLAIWLMMVFRADRHPRYRHHVPAASRTFAGVGELAPGGEYRPGRQAASSTGGSPLPAFPRCCGAQDYARFSGTAYGVTGR